MVQPDAEASRLPSLDHADRLNPLFMALERMETTACYRIPDLDGPVARG